MDYLPEELLEMIFLYLDLKSLIYLKRLCKYFNILSLLDNLVFKEKEKIINFNTNFIEIDKDFFSWIIYESYGYGIRTNNNFCLICVAQSISDIKNTEFYMYEDYNILNIVLNKYGRIIFNKQNLKFVNSNHFNQIRVGIDQILKLYIFTKSY